MRFFASLAIVLLLIPSNICGLMAQSESCMPNGCCCVSQSEDAPAESPSSISNRCCCKADRAPAPSDKQHQPARAIADTSIENVGPLACVTIVAIEFDYSVMSENIWRHVAPRAPPTAVYFATQRILC